MIVRVMLPAALLMSACAPTLVQGSMQNPAKTTQQLESSQEYDIGPYKENHRYSVSLKGWTPSSLGAVIKLVDDASCADVNHYTFTLVDDKGTRYPFVPAKDPVQTSEHGRADALLTATVIDGKFEAPIGAGTTAVTVQLRSAKGVDCPALDFRWDLK